MVKPKVLLLGKLPPPYMGPAISTQILLNSTLRERYDLCHINTNVHKSITTIGTLSLKKIRKNLSIYARFVRALRQEQPDLVLIPISQATLGFLKDSFFILLSRLYGRQVLLHLHGSNLKNWLRSVARPTRAYIEFVLRSAQGAIVLGNNLRHLFATYYPQERIFVVPNGADCQIPVQAKGRPPETMHLLYLANLMTSKGIEDILEAAHLLQEQDTADFKVDVVGAWQDADTKERCRALMDKYQPPVTFHDVATGTQKFQYFANADIFVFTPREPEGHPWVIVEALAAGLPIITTDQGAITESVLDGVNGFIVDVKSPEQIAERLQRLIDNPDLRQRFGQASRAHHLEHFTEKTMVDRLCFAIDALVLSVPTRAVRQPA